MLVAVAERRGQRIDGVTVDYYGAQTPLNQVANITVEDARTLAISPWEKSMVPAIEKMLVTPAVANQIREGHEHHMRSAMQTGVEDGMLTLERSLAGLVRRRLITPETALGFAQQPRDFEQRLGR